jgi:hypothetical protein
MNYNCNIETSGFLQVVGLPHWGDGFADPFVWQLRGGVILAEKILQVAKDCLKEYNTAYERYHEDTTFKEMLDNGVLVQRASIIAVMKDYKMQILVGTVAMNPHGLSTPARFISALEYCVERENIKEDSVQEEE